MLADRTPRVGGGSGPARSCKRPIGVGGAAAKVNDPWTWMPFEDACDAALTDDRAGGLGIMLEGQGLTALDLDHVLRAGVLAPGVAELLDALPVTYTEISPGGDGLHVLIADPMPEGWKCVATDPFGPGTRLESYDHARYLIITGRVLRGSSQRLAGWSAEAVHALGEILSSPPGQPEQHPAEPDAHAGVEPELIHAALGVIDPDCSYPDWIATCMALWTLQDALGGPEQAFAVFEAWSARGEKHIQGEPLTKWQSIDARPREDRPGFATLARLADASGKRWRTPEPDFDDATFTPPATPAETARQGLQYQDIATGRREVAGQRFAIAGLLPAKGVVQVYGESGTGKSAWCLAAGFAIATGEATFCGKAVLVHGPVALIVGEDRSGALTRCAAECHSRGIEPNADVPVRISNMPTRLLDEKDLAAHAQAIIEACGGKPALVIVDTLATNYGAGSEDSTEDMTTAMRNAIALQAALDCLLIIVHHVSKANKAVARGNGAFLAAVDATLQVTADPSSLIVPPTTGDDMWPPVAGRSHPTGKLVRITPKKARNWAPAEPFLMQLVAIETGEHWDGIPETGVTLQLFEGLPAAPGSRPEGFPVELERAVERILELISKGVFSSRELRDGELALEPVFEALSREARRGLTGSLQTAGLITNAGTPGRARWVITQTGAEWLVQRML